MGGTIGPPESKEELLAFGSLPVNVGVPQELVVYPEAQYSDRFVQGVGDGVQGYSGGEDDGVIGDSFMLEEEVDGSGFVTCKRD